MKLLRLLPIFFVITLVCVGSKPLYAVNNGAFIVEMKTEAKTIGDIRPVFIVYKDKELPKVTVKYLLKKYIKLFDKAQSPAVKLDALNRINNLRVKYNITNKKLAIDNIRQSKVVLETYERVIDSDISWQRMDELIYEAAKAQSFLGNEKESIKRLKMLTGLYPNSKLFDESNFRMAEANFNLGEYSNAESAYKKILTFSKTNDFHQRARFKLGWSIFKLDRYDEAGKTAIDTLDHYPALAGALSVSAAAEEDQDLIDDTFKLLSLLFSKQKNAETIEVLQQAVSNKQYAFLLYDSLFRFYLAQDRFEDGALITDAYTSNYPVDFNAYLMATNTIKTYKKGGFDIQEWLAKERFVESFGIKSDYWQRLAQEQMDVIKPLVNQYLGELAHSYYVRMQNSIKQKAKYSVYSDFAKRSADYYLEIVATSPKDKGNAENLYLAAEALNRTSKSKAEFLNVINIYEQAAYKYNRGYAVSVKAGYAAILGYDKLKTSESSGAKVLTPIYTKKRQASIESYAVSFPENINTPTLLNDLANELFNARDFANAQAVSAKVVASRAAKPNVLYSSWLVNAHSSFELQAYQTAEKAYQAALSFKRENGKNVLQERLAASIYKQAEAESNMLISADLYLKVVDTVPDSSIVPQALYDASSQLLAAKKWGQAIATLSHFQSAFPDHELYNETSEKLIFAFIENKELVSAAEILKRVATSSPDKIKAANYLYRAADLYHSNGFEYEGVQLFKKFINRYKQMFDLNIEAHHLIVQFNEGSGNIKISNTWKQSLVEYEKQGVSKRTDRSAYLASHAALSLAMQDYDVFEQLKLTLPLKKSLAKKKTLLTDVVKKFESLVDYDVSEIISASTYQIAQVYRTLAQDLMLSERPSELNALQLEQYDILLEEQAYPFEEQALGIYKINLSKVPDGQFDEWIKLSLNVLEEMNPAEYKREFKEVSHAANVF
ncbi:MAG: TolA-binding protein [Pseudohongiellaceae bacterium]|jgi:TolA-binding protein